MPSAGARPPTSSSERWSRPNRVASSTVGGVALVSTTSSPCESIFSPLVAPAPAQVTINFPTGWFGSSMDWIPAQLRRPSRSTVPTTVSFVASMMARRPSTVTLPSTVALPSTTKTRVPTATARLGKGSTGCGDAGKDGLDVVHRRPADRSLDVVPGRGGAVLVGHGVQRLRVAAVRRVVAARVAQVDAADVGNVPTRVVAVPDHHQASFWWCEPPVRTRMSRITSAPRRCRPRPAGRSPGR